MSKLLAENRFFDFSDYGRPIALQIANTLKNTAATPVHVTISFVISGLIAIICMLTHHYAIAGFFLIFKSILDAADGELARLKNTPSYTGRFLDSNCDIVLNALFLTTICYISNGSWFYTFLAFIGLQLQGTLYNYYYVIIRHKLAGGDTTSRIFENEVPIAMKGEKQATVNVLFYIYTVFYGHFDKIIQKLDTKAIEARPFPNWFMSLISLYGLGFQLLIMAVMMALDLMDFIIPFFIFYSLLLGVFIGIRRQFIV
jgi:CDP-diacylglycerol---serine O-phosphatidyltransferase